MTVFPENRGFCKQCGGLISKHESVVEFEGDYYHRSCIPLLDNPRELLPDVPYPMHHKTNAAYSWLRS